MLELALFLIATFTFGTIIGSFLNVLIYRLYQGASIIGRSNCQNCQVNIKPRHLIPILSWLVLKGRCAHCGKRIHIQYPLVEFATGAIFAVTGTLEWGSLIRGDISWLALLLNLAFIAVLVLCVVFDLRWKLLPIEIMAGTGVFFAIYNVFTGVFTFEQTVLAIAVGAGFLGLQYLATRGRSLGGGDIWLGAMLGATLGWPGIGISLYLTYVIGGITLAVFLAFGIVKKTSRIPFAPLLAMGALATIWFGKILEQWWITWWVR